MLDGELAVPCNPQSALAGSNSHWRAVWRRPDFKPVAMKVRSCAIYARPTPPGPEGSNGKRKRNVPQESLTGAGCLKSAPKEEQKWVHENIYQKRWEYDLFSFSPKIQTPKLRRSNRTGTYHHHPVQRHQNQPCGTSISICRSQREWEDNLRPNFIQSPKL